MVGSGRFYFGWWWVVVGNFRVWLMWFILLGVGFLLDGGGWSWVFFGWWWVMMDGGGSR